MMTHQRGNILFLILLAVVLFAALSYAVVSGMRGGGNNATNENAQSAAADILNFLSNVETAVSRMRLSKELKPENISFEYTYKNYGGSTYTGNINSNCTSDNCRLFKPDGGGVSPRNFESYGKDPGNLTPTNVMPGYFNIIMIQWPYAGTDLNDLVMELAYVRGEICDPINNALGNTTNPTLTGTWLNAAQPANWDTTGQVIGPSSALVGKSTIGRSYSTTNGRVCSIYQLLVAR